MEIPTNQIDPPIVLMRPVLTDSAEFRMLCDSIRDFGMHNSILCRPRGDRFQLVDGAWRLAAHRDLGLPEIEAIVREVSDADVLACQIQANAVRPQTSRVDFAKQLLRIQQAYPHLTMAMLAKYAGKNTYWVRQQLDLLDLRPEYQAMADRGLLPVMNAYTLAKLPPHMQGRHIEAALKLSPPEFKALVAVEIQRLTMNAKTRSEEKRLAARMSAPQPFLKPYKALVSELGSGSAARGLVAAVKPTNVVEAFRLGVQWALNVDPLSMEDRKQKMAEETIDRTISRKPPDCSAGDPTSAG